MDIVERLKCSLFGSVEREAAYEIERLREQAHYHYENGLKKDVEIERLLEALQTIAEEGSGNGQAIAYAALKESE